LVLIGTKEVYLLTKITLKQDIMMKTLEKLIKYGSVAAVLGLSTTLSYAGNNNNNEENIVSSESAVDSLLQLVQENELDELIVYITENAKTLYITQFNMYEGDAHTEEREKYTYLRKLNTYQCVSNKLTKLLKAYISISDQELTESDPAKLASELSKELTLSNRTLKHFLNFMEYIRIEEGKVREEWYQLPVSLITNSFGIYQDHYRAEALLNALIELSDDSEEDSESDKSLWTFIHNYDIEGLIESIQNDVHELIASKYAGASCSKTGEEQGASELQSAFSLLVEKLTTLAQEYINKENFETEILRRLRHFIKRAIEEENAAMENINIYETYIGSSSDVYPIINAIDKILESEIIIFDNEFFDILRGVENNNNNEENPFVNGEEDLSQETKGKGFFSGWFG